ncbi:MAG: protein O-mannosyl-transferase [Verrucomicrobiota bacterium]|jgi:tetratricopeptide (TPR) repeat protein
MSNLLRRANDTNPQWIVAGVCIFLTALTWLVFGRTLAHDFVNYDDPTYVYENPIVSQGLTFHGVGWAFTHAHARNWHPLTTISHMVDCQFFGLNAAGHHFTNVFLHTIAVLVLFLLLRDMTGALWRSAFVAELFAIHPLRVESVAWIAERKDVLSGVFFMLTLWAYARYARQPSLRRYIIMSILFALGLMAKPMLVTLPFVLLLLDYWPARRIADRRSLFLVITEKIPLFVLSAASCFATIIAQSGPLGAVEQLPFAWRTANALVSYVTYIWQMLWPADLAAFYPHPGNHLETWEISCAAAIVLAITFMAIIWRKTQPHLFVGWFWYIGMLIPVIGIFQIGLQGHADRYTYLPQVGLYLLIAWSVSEMSILRGRREVLFALSAIAIVPLAWRAWDHTATWKNSETLWKHALAVTSDNDVAHYHLGLFFRQHDQMDAALAQYQAALRIQLAEREPHYNLSTALTYNNIANILMAKGRFAEAVLHFEKALALRPDFADARYNLGGVFFRQGRVDDAIAQLQSALSLQPEDGEAHRSLGRAFLQKGSVSDAIAEYEKAVKAANPSIVAANDLAWILSTYPDDSVRNGTKALALARGAVAFTHGAVPLFLRTLAAAEAETGHFDDALKAAQHGLELARSQNNSELADRIEKDVDLYRAKNPVRDSSLINAEPNF